MTQRGYLHFAHPTAFEMLNFALQADTNSLTGWLIVPQVCKFWIIYLLCRNVAMKGTVRTALSAPPYIHSVGWYSCLMNKAVMVRLW